MYTNQSNTTAHITMLISNCLLSSCHSLDSVCFSSD
uniref:Uncharacterized protein n=1 Tax=Anguilla anguilla TaxID=7936 RepID=A0A0E9PJY8_ANGAN